MSAEALVPNTKVLAIASHVVYGYVGNTMAAFVMQTLGCEVAALNTVHYSNHTGYKSFRGTRITPEEIVEIYNGLKQNHLTDFDIMLSGYAPSAQVVDAIGTIGRDLKLKASTKAGSFFWVLDPVMGDEGCIYVSEDAVPAYRCLLSEVDLIVPNQFEVELLANVRITGMADVITAITKLHQENRLPHIIVTSVRFDYNSPTISIVGSSARADLSPRLFKIDVPALDCFFSGTGDMFAALTVVRFREAASQSGLVQKSSWLSPDEVEAIDLPLAKAAEKVLGSMQDVLVKTKHARDEELAHLMGSQGSLEKNSEKMIHLRKTKAAEVRLVRNLEDLRAPRAQFRAEPLSKTGG